MEWQNRQEGDGVTRPDTSRSRVHRMFLRSWESSTLLDPSRHLSAFQRVDQVLWR
jgi:hypothetical protein